MNLFDKYEGERGGGEGGKIERMSQHFRRLLNEGNTEAGAVRLHRFDNA